ncbi:hypothetical protein GUH96_17300 [Xanthomonas citri pv. citri]|nr:hypothetical protein [Xanthomonas citri pv. citri]
MIFHRSGTCLRRGLRRGDCCRTAPAQAGVGEVRQQLHGIGIAHVRCMGNPKDGLASQLLAAIFVQVI